MGEELHRSIRGGVKGLYENLLRTCLTQVTHNFTIMTRLDVYTTNFT
jgi:hypothetical protein